MEWEKAGRWNQDLGFWQIGLYPGNILVSLLSLRSLPIPHVHQNLSVNRFLYVIFRSVQLFLCSSTWECSKRFRKSCRDTYFDIWETLSPCHITNIIRYPWQRDRNCGTGWMTLLWKHSSQEDGQFITRCSAESVWHRGGNAPQEPVIRGCSYKGNVMPSTQGLPEEENCHCVLPLRLNIIQIWWMWKERAELGATEKGRMMYSRRESLIIHHADRDKRRYNHASLLERQT